MSFTILSWAEKKIVFKETSPFLQKVKQVQTPFLAKQDKDSFFLGNVLAWHQVERILYTDIRSLASLKARYSKAKEQSKVSTCNLGKMLKYIPHHHLLFFKVDFYRPFRLRYVNICSQEGISILQNTTEVYKIHPTTRSNLLGSSISLN